MKPRVVVIGAGLGGLSAAIHLASRGMEVEVFEKNERVGGKAGEWRREGFRFDTGPSLLTMPFVLDELFIAAGKRTSDYLTLQPIDPLCRYFFSDGSVFDAYSHLEKMRRSIEEFSPRDVGNYERFLKYSERIYDLTSRVFIFNSWSNCGSLLTWGNARTLLRIWQIDPFRNVHQAVSSYFRDPRLIQVFDRYATYNGSNPYRAPATLNVIPWVEYGMGGYYIRGGVYRLSEALERCARELGVKFTLGMPVQRILESGGRVNGVQCETGRMVECDAVVSNADAVYTLTRLVGDQKAAAGLRDVEPSSSGLVFLWGVKGQHPELAHHNIFFSRDYKKEFDELFVSKAPPSDPTVYVSITSKTDSDHAPAGCENWFVLINMPAIREPGLETNAALIRARIHAKLRERGLDVEGRILFEHVITPEDFLARFNAYRGSIYGISSNSRRAAFLRPRNRTRHPKGLYLCGGAAHPGGGMPLVLISGKLAAELCTEDLL